MNFWWKSLLFITTLVSIDCKNQQNLTTSDKKLSIAAKNEGLESDPTKTDHLLTDDQNYNYHYVKPKDSFNDHTGKSYLKEVHYFHDKEVEFERKHDWDSGRFKYRRSECLAEAGKDGK